jgi:N-acetylglucosamine-6-phosphate deacetylase
VANGVVRLQGSGQLAGSCLSLAGALRALHAWQPQLPLADLLRMASANAAQALGRAAEYGRLSEGAPADVVLLDASLQVTRTLVGGVVVSA